MFGLTLDLTITLGNIISLAGTLGGLFVLYLKQREQLAEMRLQVNTLWKAYTEGKLHFPGDRR